VHRVFRFTQHVREEAHINTLSNFHCLVLRQQGESPSRKKSGEKDTRTVAGEDEDRKARKEGQVPLIVIKSQKTLHRLLGGCRRD